MGRRLPRSFFSRPSTEVAPDLLGVVIARRLPDGTVLRAALVETEAYEPTDPASHAFNGPTPRNATMFGPAGHLYVYFIYGMHHCMNVVTRRLGEGSAVLLRAAEPLEGLDAMAAARGRPPARDLCRGPARLTQAFGVDRACDGADLVDGPDLWLEPGRTPVRIRRGPRVGLTRAADRRWRFWEEGSPWVSAGIRAVRSEDRRTRSA